MAWRLNRSVGRVSRDGTAWLALELRQVDATRDTSALKVCGAGGRVGIVGSGGYKTIDLFVLF